jgi:soluble lytic murein transglycosylase-like protein
MKQESAGLTTLNGQPITSRAGAMGLMQLMPGTWSDMRDRYGLGNNPFDPLISAKCTTATVIPLCLSRIMLVLVARMRFSPV